MDSIIELRKEVDWVISSGDARNLNNLIIKLYNCSNQEALDEVVKLAVSDFDGFTLKGEMQNIALLAVLYWQLEGLKRLLDKVILIEGYRPVLNIFYFLSFISSKSLEYFGYGDFNLECIKVLDLKNNKYKSDDWVTFARESLITVVKSVEKEDMFPTSLLLHFVFNDHPIASEHRFAALVARWFNLNSQGIEAYKNIISKKDVEEIECHNFLKNNPYLLEPFHAQIWSKPRFGEELVPDFLIRSMDDSYTIVEIEKPSKKIMTKSGELSAETNHARRQALEFRDWAISNSLYAKQKFQNIYRPACLVVIGLEEELNDLQRVRLRQENESTQGVLKIVGFDWIYNRVKSTLENLIKYGFERDSIKKVI